MTETCNAPIAAATAAVEVELFFTGSLFGRAVKLFVAVAITTTNRPSAVDGTVTVARFAPFMGEHVAGRLVTACDTALEHWYHAYSIVGAEVPVTVDVAVRVLPTR